MDITERFLNYTKFDTQSKEDSDQVPSTEKQLVIQVQTVLVLTSRPAS